MRKFQYHLQPRYENSKSQAYSVQIDLRDLVLTAMFIWVLIGLNSKISIFISLNFLRSQKIVMGRGDSTIMVSGKTLKYSQIFVRKACLLVDPWLLETNFSLDWPNCKHLVLLHLF